MLFALLLAGAVAETTGADTIQYRVTEALVVDKDGKPLFRAPRDFLLQVSGNPAARIVAYDAASRRVRVSEHQAWWISCSDLQPQAVACAQAERPKTRSISLPPQGSVPGDGITGPDGRGVPSCPGDPRCPTGD
jgi:hypothetical protein